MALKAGKYSLFLQVFFFVVVHGSALYASPLCTTSLQTSRSGKDLFKTSEFAAYKAKDGEVGLQLSDNFLNSTEVVRGKSTHGYVKLSGKHFTSAGKAVSLVDVYSSDEGWTIIRHGDRSNGYVATINGKEVTCKEYRPNIAAELEEYLSAKYTRFDEKTAVLTRASALADKLFGSIQNPKAS
jgi:hypothetical protein